MTDKLTTAFDPAKLAEGVRDRIRGTILDLIPEDAWKAMIQREIDTFLHPTRSTYGGRDEPSGLSVIVKQVLEQELRKQLAAMFASPAWQPFWDGQAQAASAEVQRIVTESADTMLKNLLGNAIQQAVQGMACQLQHPR